MSRNDHGDDLSNKCSRGVHTSDNQFPQSSESDVNRCNKHVVQSKSQDADQSAMSDVVTNHELSGQNHRLTSDTDAEYYRMKTLQRKGLKTHPCKIEFQLVKQSVKQKNKLLRHSLRQSSPLSIRHKCQCEIVKHCCKDELANAKSEEIKETVKIPNMFTWFKRQPAKKVNFFEDANFKSKNRDLENADVYHFDHGTPAFYQTTDCPPHLISEIIAQRTTYHATRFWAELFGTLNIGVTFCITFLLQFYRFILYSMLRAIIVGFLQITSDYFIKPLLAVLFNGLCQPPFIFIRNVLQAVCGMLNPIVELLTTFLRPITGLIRAFRVVEVKNINRQWQETGGKRKLKVLQGQSLV